MRIGHHILPAGGPLFVIAGPCVIEGEAHTLAIARELQAISTRLKVPLIFKASFDKANRSAQASFRGPGMDEGLRILAAVRAETGLPVLTDIHTPDQAAPVAAVVDCLQIPAFLARQTDLIAAAAATGRPVNVKKGQFMAPVDMNQVVAKARAVNADAPLMLTERGSSFGYHNLVVDMRGLDIMAKTGCPVVFDATHAVQQPGALGDRSGGDRHFVPLLARAAVAAGIDGLFMETHPDPDRALSDGPNAWPLNRFEGLLAQLATLHTLSRQFQGAPALAGASNAGGVQGDHAP